MAQPQPAIPEYPHPDGVTDEWRNAPTPPPIAAQDQNEVLQVDPVSDHLLESDSERANTDAYNQLTAQLGEWAEPNQSLRS